MRILIVFLIIAALIALFYFKFLPKTAMKGIEGGFGSKDIEELNTSK